MINITDELHAATEQGIVASSTEISIPDSEETVADALARQQQEIDDIERGLPSDYAKQEDVDEIKKAVGIADFESAIGLQSCNCELGYINDGDYYLDDEHVTDLDSLEEGSIVKVTAIPVTDKDYVVPTTVDTNALYADNNGELFGVTEWMPIKAGHYYRVTGIYETISGGNAVYTFEEVEIVTSHLEEQADNINTHLGSDSDSAAETGTLFAILKWCKNKIVSIYNALTDNTNGLGAIKTAASNAASDASDAKTSSASAATAAGTVNTHLGSDSDSAAETGTLFAILKWCKGKIADILTAIGNMPSVPTVQQIQDGLAKETQTKDGNDTVIAVAKANKERIGQITPNYTEHVLPGVKENGYACEAWYDQQTGELSNEMSYEADFPQASHATDYKVGDIICIDDECTEDDRYCGIKAVLNNASYTVSTGSQAQNVWEFSNIETFLWQKGHYYRITDIVEVPNASDNTQKLHVFVYEEVATTVMDSFRALIKALATLQVTLTAANLDYLASQITGLDLSQQQINDLASAIATALGTVTATLTNAQIADIVTAIGNGVTIAQLNTTIGNAAQAATTAGQAATTAGQTASTAAQTAQTAAANAASLLAEVQELMTEAEVLAIPHQAAINIITPQEHSGAVANLAINPNVMYTLGDLTALSLIMQTPADANVYNEYMVQFYCQTGFTLAVTHYDGQTTVLFPYGASCEAGHHYVLSIVNNIALLAKG